MKLNQELLQLSNFESNVSEQYREGEQAQRNINKLLLASYSGLTASVGGDGVGVGPLSQGQIRVGGNGQSLNEKIFLPSVYHWCKLQEFVNSIHALTTQVAVVEEYLASQGQSATGQPNTASLSNPQALTGILHAQHTALVSVSGRISTLHEQVNAVRDRFTHLFGRAGLQRLDEERKKELKKREAFDLNAPNMVALVSNHQPTTTTAGAAAAPAATATAAAPAATGFGFGATAPAASTSGGFGFGSTSAATTTTGGFALGPAAATTQPALGQSLFGNTTSTTAAPATGGFSLPSTTTTTGGFGFGTSTPATSTAPAAGGFGFGTTTPAASTGGFGFGTTTGFGATTPASQPKLTRQTSTLNGRKK